MALPAPTTHGYRICLLSICLLAASLTNPANAADHYAATTGTPTGAGTIGDPWDLQTALNGGAPHATVQPGDTIWVRGGVYLAPFSVFVKGTPAQPIVVRNYDDERVVLDGQYSECNPAGCPPAEWQAANPWFPACPSGINSQCNSYSYASPCDPYENPQCTAPFNARLDVLWIPRSTHDVWVWGFEIADLGETLRHHIAAACTTENPATACCFENGFLIPECNIPNALIPKTYRSPTVIEGERVKLINCAVHNGGIGFGWFTRSVDSEVYGSLSFHAGFASALRGMYHGCYTQNVDSLDHPSEKVFTDTIFFNNYGLGAQIYGSCGPAAHYSLDGVVSFSTTVPAKEFYKTVTPGIMPAGKTTESQDSILLGSSRSSHRSSIRNTYVYNALDQDGVPTFDYGSIPLRIRSFADLLVEDSVFAGDGGGVVFDKVSQLRFSGNTVVGRPYYPSKQGLVSILDTHYDVHVPLHEFSSNEYYRTDGAPGIGIQAGWPAEFHVPLADWQSVYGQDLDSNGYTGRPIANQVFVRPNAYETGRGHVIIYNWVGLDDVPVDLTPLGLSQGQAFKVHNILSFKTDPNAPDWYGNVAASGTFDSGDPWVDVDMTDTDVTSPIGSSVPLPSTLPEFGAFLVVPQ